ncbi:MAG: FtsW/RodA/SpoVE family cell cycle protein, partial [Acidobacteriota bacterium]
MSVHAHSQAHVGSPAIVAPRSGFDWWLVAFAVALAGLGVVMVLSASGIMAERMVHDKYFFFKKQAIFLGIGVCLMFFVAWLPRKILYGPVYLWLFVVLALLAMTMIPPFSVKAGGARRWMHLGPLLLQPMELAKVVLVFYLA